MIQLFKNMPTRHASCLSHVIQTVEPHHRPQNRIKRKVVATRCYGVCQFPAEEDSEPQEQGVVRRAIELLQQPPNQSSIYIRASFGCDFRNRISVQLYNSPPFDAAVGLHNNIPPRVHPGCALFVRSMRDKDSADPTPLLRF